VGARERHLHSIARPHPVRFPFRSDPKLSNSGYSLPQIDRIFHLFFVGAFFSGFWVGLSWVAMRIEEFQSKLGGEGEGGLDGGEERIAASVVMRVAVDAMRTAVSVSARMLFYPTLVYNVVRNRFEAHFHGWDQVHEVRQFSSFFIFDGFCS
jgi:hypothetical protein